MPERIGHEPADTRDVSRNRENPLLEAARDLARAVAEIYPNPEYSTQPPRAYIVGGYVRDIHLGLQPKDADVEVYGVAPAELISLLIKMFGKINDVGQAFGIIKVPIGDGLELDVSIPRRESKAGKGHTGFLIDSEPSLDITEAARRRDFTVNAMAMDPITGVFFDPFGGMEDLRSKTLRVTDSEKFADDPLRVLRAAQFLARLEFTAEEKSFEIMKGVVERGEMDELPKERIGGELEKLLLKSKRPSVGFEFMRVVGMTERKFPELHALIGVPQEPEWHPEGDVWTHTMMVIDAGAKIANDSARGFSDDERLQVMLGALGHDLGKPSTTTVEDGRIRSKGHEPAGEAPVRELFSRLVFKGHQGALDATVAIAREHLQPGELHRSFIAGKLTEAQYANAIRKLLKRISPVSWRVLIAASEADSRGRLLPGVDTVAYEPGVRFAEMIAKYGIDKAAKEALLQGRDLIAEFQLNPRNNNTGRFFGEVLRAVEAERDEGAVTTREQALQFVRPMVEQYQAEQSKAR